MTDQTPLTDQQLDDIEARATSKHLTPGPWRVEQESCDCGGDYPCGHGMYVTGVSAPTPTEIAAERCKRTGEQPRDYDFHRSEIGDFTSADWELMVHAREDVPALVAEVRRLRAELADFSGRVNELESKLCDCEPVREHDDYRRPAFYQHELHCPVNAPAPSA